jgi:hypothetical protein
LDVAAFEFLDLVAPLQGKLGFRQAEHDCFLPVGVNVERCIDTVAFDGLVRQVEIEAFFFSSSCIGKKSQLTDSPHTA